MVQNFDGIRYLPLRGQCGCQIFVSRSPGKPCFRLRQKVDRLLIPVRSTAAQRYPSFPENARDKIRRTQRRP